MSCELKKEFEKNKKTILVIVVTVLTVVVVFSVANVFFGQKNNSEPTINNVIKNSSEPTGEKVNDSNFKTPKERKKEITMNTSPSRNDFDPRRNWTK